MIAYLVRTLLPEEFLAGTNSQAGQIPHTLDAAIPEYAMGLYMNFWIPNDAVQDGFGGNKVDNVYPMVTEYDWFRYYSLDGYEEVVVGEIPEEVVLEENNPDDFPDQLTIFVDSLEPSFRPNS